MAKIHKSLIGQVTAGTPANVVTTDEATHTFRRWYPKGECSENSAAAFAKGIADLVAFATAVAKGEKVDITDDDGKTLKSLTPTDDTPKQTANKTEDKDKDGKVTGVTVDHGANMAKSLPVSYTDLMTALNVGMQNLIGRDARAAVVEEYRKGGGKRGRGPTEVNFDEAN